MYRVINKTKYFQLIENIKRHGHYEFKCQNGTVYLKGLWTLKICHHEAKKQSWLHWIHVNFDSHIIKIEHAFKSSSCACKCE